MAVIDKKLIHFTNLATFEQRLDAGDIKDTSIVFIQDAKRIWTHGLYYSSPYTKEEIDQLFVGSNVTLDGYSENGVAEIISTDTVNEAFGKIEDFLTGLTDLNAILVDTGDVASDPTINDYITPSELNSTLSNYATTTRVDNLELSTKIITTEGDGNKYLADNGEYKNVVTDLSDYYTKEEINLQISSIPQPDLSEYIKDAPVDDITYNRKNGEWVAAEKTPNYKITAIKIDQSVSDPDTMITRIIDEGGIEAIRANSHRYVGEIIDDVMTLRQLDDYDGTKYLDGTTATYDDNKYVWMRLPEFYWKLTKTANGNILIYVAYGDMPDLNYNKWDSQELFGVYAVSFGGASHPGISVYNGGVVTEYLIRKGYENFGLKHQNILAILFYVYYGTTDYINTLGDRYLYKTTGITELLGMVDTTYDSNMLVNFWGIEGLYSYNPILLQDIVLKGYQYEVAHIRNGKITSFMYDYSPTTGHYVTYVDIFNNYLLPADSDYDATNGLYFCTTSDSITSSSEYAKNIFSTSIIGLSTHKSMPTNAITRFAYYLKSPYKIVE